VTVKANAKFLLLLKATKNVGVVTNRLAVTLSRKSVEYGSTQNHKYQESDWHLRFAT
jgi:hypothetical protein